MNMFFIYIWYKTELYSNRTTISNCNLILKIYFYHLIWKLFIEEQHTYVWAEPITYIFHSSHGKLTLISGHFEGSYYQSTIWKFNFPIYTSSIRPSYASFTYKIINMKISWNEVHMMNMHGYSSRRWLW